MYNIYAAIIVIPNMFEYGWHGKIINQTTKCALHNCEIENMQIKCRTQYENKQFTAHFNP